jgi:hypothetical protein
VLSDSTPGSTICYTTDGTTPGASVAGTCNSDGHTQTYSSPILVNATNTQIQALGTEAGDSNSSVVSATYTLNVANLVASPGPGVVILGTGVLLTTITQGASIRYTLDGSTPSCPSTGSLYNIQVQITSNETLNAIACQTNYNPSSVLSSAYTARRKKQRRPLP